ncbi:MAG: hypothetical protein ACKVS9_03315 [Phycisphaerae bacterium]
MSARTNASVAFLTLAAIAFSAGLTGSASAIDCDNGHLGPNTLACVTCVSSNNCGTCKDGVCDAPTYLVCSTIPLVQTLVCGGNDILYISAQLCWVSYHCPASPGCNGPCVSSTEEIASASSDFVDVPSLGDPCPPCP